MFDKIAMDMLAKQRRKQQRANHANYVRLARSTAPDAWEDFDADHEGTLHRKAHKPMEKAASLHMHRLRGKKNRAERLAARNG